MKFPRLFNRSTPIEVKESAVGASIVTSPGQPVWSGRDYAHFAREAYQENVVAARCISSIAEAFGSLSLLAYKGDQELASHWALDLLKNPNPQQSGPELMEARASFYLIAGNVYDEKVRASGSEPKELYVLRPDRMKVIPGAGGVPIGYEYDVNGKKTRWSVERDGSCDVLHTKTFHPTDDWYGLSPVESGAKAVDIHNESMGWMMALLQNGAQPSGALVHDAKDGGSLSDDQFARLKAEMEASHQGAKNAGRPMLLEGGLDWRPMALSPRDMGLIDQKNSAARDTCLAFGVPPMLIGIPGDNTYSNYAEARLAFWEDTVLPLSGRLLDGLSEWLTGGEIAIRPDLDKIPAIVDKRRTLWTMLDQTQSLTLNEKREAMGYEPVSGGDDVSADTPSQPSEADQKSAAFIAGYERPKLREVK